MSAAAGIVLLESRRDVVGNARVMSSGINVAAKDVDGALFDAVHDGYQEQDPRHRNFLVFSGTADLGTQSLMRN